MKVISSPEEILRITSLSKKEELDVGLVPTMGALHDGHLTIVKRCIKENNISVVSIFVNPLQFNNSEDLEAYPRDEDGDLSKLKSLGVDYVFIPSANLFYKNKPEIVFSFGELGQVLEGKYRQGHFEGVGIVVTKLFNLVQPDRAYFGLKDLQQFIIIKKLVESLSFPIQIKGVETVRENTGLAMSSRNKRLSKEGLVIASNIFKTLKKGEQGIINAEPIEAIMDQMHDSLLSIEGLEIEYLSIADGNSLKEIKSYEGVNELAICFAGYVEGVRLIDNLYLRLN